MVSNQPRRAVIYCRVSTKEQATEGNSLVSQERHCKEYAAKHGYEIVATFIEEGESAKTVDRTELKKLMAFCGTKKHGINVVIAYKIDRISRNTDDYSQIRVLFKRFGVEIKYTTEFFEDTPAGRFMENIIANVAQFDNDVRAERSIGGMRDAVREGRYVWLAPYGYSNVRVNGKATIAPNEKAIFVQKVFEAVAAQQSTLTTIRETLAQQGMVTKNGKPISRSHFYTMLKTELYTGWINQFNERNKGTFEPIISETLFNTVQHILYGKSNSHPLRHQKENSDFPLRRFFRHPSGKAMTGCWSKGNSKKYPYYLVPHQKINIRKEVFEEAFKNWLNQFRMDIDYFETLYAIVKQQTSEGIQHSQKHTEEIKTHIEVLKGKQMAYVNKNIEGIISDELCKEQVTIIDTEIYQLQQQLATMKSDSVNYPKLLEDIREILLYPGDSWQNAPIEKKIRLQWFYFPKGIEFDGNENRTQEICSLFKLKSQFSSYMFSDVDHSNKKSNISFKQVLSEVNVFDRLTCLENMKQELIKLKTILHPSNDTPHTLSNI